jgi:hypothetical protein
MLDGKCKWCGREGRARLLRFNGTSDFVGCEREDWTVGRERVVEYRLDKFSSGCFPFDKLRVWMTAKTNNISWQRGNNSFWQR